MSVREKKAVGYLLLAQALWSTDNLHNLNSTTVAYFASVLTFCSRIGVLDWKETEKTIPWELFVYFGGVLTLSGALLKPQSFDWLIKQGSRPLGCRPCPCCLF